jgi:TnpA family transposase
MDLIGFGRADENGAQSIIIVQMGFEPKLKAINLQNFVDREGNKRFH